MQNTTNDLRVVSEFDPGDITVIETPYSFANVRTEVANELPEERWRRLQTQDFVEFPDYSTYNKNYRDDLFNHIEVDLFSVTSLY